MLRMETTLEADTAEELRAGLKVWADHYASLTRPAESPEAETDDAAFRLLRDRVAELARERDRVEAEAHKCIDAWKAATERKDEAIERLEAEHNALDKRCAEAESERDMYQRELKATREDRDKYANDLFQHRIAADADVSRLTEEWDKYREQRDENAVDYVACVTAIESERDRLQTQARILARAFAAVFEPGTGAPDFVIEAIPVANEIMARDEAPLATPEVPAEPEPAPPPASEFQHVTCYDT